MHYISVETMANMNSDANDVSLQDYTDGLTEALKRKNSGTVCENCGNELWAAGTAVVGWDACFPCITGTVDDSDDYEVV